MAQSNASLPISEKAAQQDDLAGVVGVVVGNEQGFAQERLAGAVRERLQQVHGFVVQ